MSIKRVKGAIADPIQWYEGMLLLPQHFQQADQRQNELLHFHMSSVTPFHWGISHFKIDPVLLVSGTLRFLELEAVMPDGLIVTRHSDESSFLEFDLTPYANQLAVKPMTIHLAIPAYRKGYANSAANVELPRYISSEGKPVIDENTGEGDIYIPRLKPNVQLMTEEMITSSYISFPMFKIAQESNAYVLRPYIPPTLIIHLDSQLGELCAQAAKRIREKIAFLVERLRSKTSNLMSAETESAVRLLSAGLLPFEAALNSGASNPYNLYVLLNTLAGQVSGLYPGQIPPTFAGYNHNDLRTTFLQVTDFVFAMIDRIQEGYSVVPFTLADRIFSLTLEESWCAPKMIFGVRAPVTQSEAELVEWIENAVIASSSRVDSIRDKRVLGAPRKIIEGVEEMQLMPAKGMVLFEVQGDHESIQAKESLKIFNIGDELKKRPLDVVLYVSKKAQEKFF